MKGKKIMEIYEGITEKGRKKKYLVTDAMADYIKTVEYAKKFFKCSEAHITVEPAYTYRDGLYFEDPMKRGTKKVTVVYWV